MNRPRPQWFDDVGECVERTLARVGPKIVLTTPLGIGKPVPLLNEFWRRALRDPRIDLTIVTALSLSLPRGSSDLERRFIEPLNARVFAGVPEPDYLAALRRGDLPPNVRVREFYVEPGAWLTNHAVQQNYLSVNYTQVARELIAQGINVIAHLVTKRTVAGETEWSLGSNPDVTCDLLPLVAAERERGRDIVFIGATNRELPFMLGDAVVPETTFDFVVESDRYEHALFGPPNLPLSTVDHAIGLHVSTQIHDGGTLQVGIGELGDAITYALLLRHQQNAAWHEALAALGTAPGAAAEDSGTFSRGLYGCSELFVDGLLDLYRGGVLKRAVYPHAGVQRLVDDGVIGERVTPETLEALLQAGVGPELTAADVAALKRAGVLTDDVGFEHGLLSLPVRGLIPPDLADPIVRAAIVEHGLGRALRDGVVLHAGFLLGPRGFYAALRDLHEDDRRRFWMTGVGFVNQLGEGRDLKIAQRRHARFVNSTMMMTLLGAAVSDGLEDGRVVSGVGGQYNFVAMAHELPEARSILTLRATRTKGGRTTSNLVWNYGHVTIPRHLRDVVITEYGVADLRGRTDRDCIAALLGIADSRFQQQLLAEAQAAGKIEPGYRIPEAHRDNTPARIERSLAPLRSRGLFSDYPFGTDLTREEVVLARALKRLQAKTANPVHRVATIAQAIVTGRVDDAMQPYLARLSLATPRNRAEWLLQRLVAVELRAQLRDAA